MSQYGYFAGEVRLVEAVTVLSDADEIRTKLGERLFHLMKSSHLFIREARKVGVKDHFHQDPRHDGLQQVDFCS